MAHPGRCRGRRGRRPHRSTPSRWPASCGSPTVSRPATPRLARSGTRLAIGKPPDDRSTAARTDPVGIGRGGRPALRDRCAARASAAGAPAAGSATSVPTASASRDRDQVAWIRALAIPPAWTDVWICTSRRGHLQATGRDARGRKQYRYHPDWRAARDEPSTSRMLAFGQALPAIRRRVDTGPAPARPAARASAGRRGAAAGEDACCGSATRNTPATTAPSA